MEIINKYERADLLWKGIIEDFIEELIQFFYSEIEEERDKSKKIEFLDKFLKQINPDSEEENRRADLLIKVPLKGGKEKWILLHIEVQGYEDPNFARRMFTYFYRTYDRFNVDIETLVIFTDTNKDYRPSFFEFNGFKTNLRYDFNIFKLVNYTPADFEGMKNPFAIIFQIALMAMKRNLKDEQLLELKVALFRKLLEQGYLKEQIRKIGLFLRDLIRFKSKEYNRIFVEQVDNLKNNKEPMGIIETVIDLNRQEAAEAGMEKGIEKGMEKGRIITGLERNIIFLNKFNKRNFADEDLSEMVDVDILFIKDFKKAFSTNKLTKLLSAIKRSRKINDLSQLKVYLVKNMYLFGFSIPVLSKYFKIKKETIEKTVNKER